MKTKFVLFNSIFCLGYIVSSAQTGNVGIGTDTPSNKLTVEGGVASPSVGTSTTNKLLALKNNQGGSSVMSLSTVSGSDTLEYFSGINTSVKAIFLYAKAPPDGNSEFMRYTFASKATTLTAGNVGIGTLTPNHLLDLGATAGSSATDVIHTGG